MNNLFRVLIYSIIFYMGVVMFAYLNEVIAALPKKKSLNRKSSRCPFCKKKQNFGDVMPLFAYIRFQGKCRYCGKSLPVREFLIQLLGGGMALLSVYFYGLTLQAVFVFLVICDVVVITFIDLDTMEIPPVLNVILFVLGALSVYALPGGPTVPERVIGLFCISIPMLLLAILCNGFGGGDVKMMFAAGALLGWKGNLAAFLIGAVLGCIYGIFVLITRKLGRKDHFAFGPFLAVGIVVSMIDQFGAGMVQAYLDYVKSLFL